MSEKDLLKFIEFLGEKVGFEFDVEDFDHRLMLQKYVYIAQKLGLKLGYGYSMYIRGPYSPLLAEDYYRLEDYYSSAGKTPKDYAPILLKGIFKDFNADKFLDVIKDKDTSWLEVAATIMSLYERFNGEYPREKLTGIILSKTFDMKCFISKRVIVGVFRDLEKEELIMS
jgi:uncharacterized protein YwgA